MRYQLTARFGRACSSPRSPPPQPSPSTSTRQCRLPDGRSVLVWTKHDPRQHPTADEADEFVDRPLFDDRTLERGGYIYSFSCCSTDRRVTGSSPGSSALSRLTYHSVPHEREIDSGRREPARSSNT